jgi:hypothetical protein
MPNERIRALVGQGGRIQALRRYRKGLRVGWLERRDVYLGVGSEPRKRVHFSSDRIAHRIAASRLPRGPRESGRSAGCVDHGDARYDCPAGCVGEHSLHNVHRWGCLFLHPCVRDCPQLGNRE